MKKIVALVLLSISAMSPAFSQKGSTPKDQTAELNDVIERINVALTEVQRVTDLPKLKTATVKLETTYDKSGGGGFKIFVKASRKWTKGSSSSITYKYEAIASIAESKVKADDLVRIIKDAAIAYQKSESILGLEKKSFEVEVAFSIKKNTAGGIEFEVYGISIDAGSEWERMVGHTITLEFE